MRKLSKVALLLLASCATPDVYVAADRATFKAIATEYRAYVEADPAMSTADKQRRIRTIETWRIRLEKAEGK